jgi:hypothetical protein
LDSTWETSGIDKETPQGIGCCLAVHVFETVCPGLAGSAADEHDTARATARRDSVAIADVHTNDIESFMRSPEAATLAPSFNVDDASD